MSKKNNTLLFLGSHSLSFHCLDYYLKNYDARTVVGIVPNLAQPPVKNNEDIRALANQHKIPILKFEQIKSVKFDLGFSLVFDKKIPIDVLQSPRLGFLNLHLGPLPYLRGRFSVYHAIRMARENNHWKFGVTLHYMDEELDTGPIIELLEFPISEEDTAYSVHSRACVKIVELFKKHIQSLTESQDPLPAKPQTGPFHLFRAGSINHEIKLDWPAEKIQDMVRALTFPGKDKPFFKIGNQKYIISLEDSNA